MSSFINFYIFSIMKQMEPLFLYAIKNAKQIYLFHIYKQIKCSNNWKIKSLIEGMLVSLLRLSIYILWTKPAILSWIVFPENSTKLLIIKKKIVWNSQNVLGENERGSTFVSRKWFSRDFQKNCKSYRRLLNLNPLPLSVY